MVKNVLDNRVIGAGGGGGGEVEADTLFTTSIGKGIFIFSEGPTGGLKTGDGKSIYLNDVALVDSAGRPTAKGVAWTWRDGLPDQTYIDGFPAAVSFQNVGVNVKQATPYAVTIANGSDNYDAAYVVVSIPQLVFKSAKGNLRKTTIAYQIQVKANGGSWVTQHNVNFTAKASSQWEGTYRVDLPVGGSPWEVRLVRITDDSDEGPRPNGEMYTNETHFARYATITDGKFTYRNTALLGIQFNAKDYGDNIPSVKVLMEGIKCYVPANYDPVTRVYATTGTGTSGGIWDGSFKAAVTNNPVWIYHDLLINNRYGLGQDFNPNDDPESAFVDKWALYSLGQYCDEMVDDGQGGTEPRFTINCQITNKQEAYDLLQNIMSSLNGMLYFSAEKIVAVADRPQSVVDAFTQADVEGGLFEYAGTALKTRHSVCIVNFKDPDNLYKTSNVIYEDPDYIQEIGYRVTEVDAFGCTSRAQALRLARWTLRTERTQTQTVSFQTGLRGGLLKPGDIIKVFDDYKTGTRTGGRILDANIADSRLNLTLDAVTTVTTADKLVYISEAGVLQEVTFDQAFTNTASISLPSTNPLPVIGGMYGIVFASLDGQQFRVLVIEEDDDGKYIVSALQHDPQKFAYIDANVVLETPRTSVLSATAVSAVTVATAVPYYEELSGTQAIPKVAISWQKPVYPNDHPDVSKRGQLDDRVVEYELQFLTPWDDYMTVYSGTQTAWSSPTLEIDETASYGARVRGRDQFGRTSDWYYLPQFAITGKSIAPQPPQSVTATSIINGIALSWNIPSNLPEYKHTEVWVNTVNNQGSATLISEVADDFYIYSDLQDDNSRYFFLRTITHNTTNNSSTYASVSGTRKTISVEDTDFIGTGATNPLTGTEGELFFNTTDGKLYRYHAGSWTAAVPTVDLTGTISNPQIADSAITLAKFASGLTPVEIVATLPVTGNYTGRTVLLTTDSKLYRYNGTSFIKTVDGADIIANSITTGKIQAGAISATEIAANAIVASKLAILDTANLILDPTFQDAAAWTTSQATPPWAINSTDTVPLAALKAVRAMKSGAPSGTTHASKYDEFTSGPLIPVEAGGKPIRFTLDWYVTAGYTARSVFYVFQYNYAGTYLGAITLGQGPDGRTVAIASATQGTLSGITTPTNADTAFIRFSCQMQRSPTLNNAGYMYISGIKFSRAVNAELVVDGTITAAKIAANTITASQIAANTITAAQIAADTITATQIAAGAITASELAANSVIAGKIAAGVVTANEIAANTITAAKIAANTITANEIAADAITAAKIAAGAVTTDKLSAGNITVALGVGSTGKILLDGTNNRIIISD